MRERTEVKLRNALRRDVHPDADRVERHLLHVVQGQDSPLALGKQLDRFPQSRAFRTFQRPFSRFERSIGKGVAAARQRCVDRESALTICGRSGAP